MTSIAQSARARQLSTHILEQPALVRALQALAPPLVTKLIRQVGLEDAGELVALLTTEQLMEVFDEDLWASDAPGEDEHFDDARFVSWLEVLLESGAELAAKKLAALDDDLLTMALHRRVLVIDLDELALTMAASDRSDEDDVVDKKLESCLSQEIDHYLVLAREAHGFEAIRTVLVELDAAEHAFSTRLLERLSALAQDYVEEQGGLYEVLSSEEMVESDVAGAREDRREQKGYVAPATARSFLAHARVTPLDELLASDELDPVTRAYFRAQPAPARADVERARPAAPVASLERLLREVGVTVSEPALPKLEGGAMKRTRGRCVATAMRWLREHDDAAYARRLEEIAYLASVLLAGDGVEGRTLRPVEAAERALATCDLGLARLARHAPFAPEQLANVSLVKLFRIGFQLDRARSATPTERTRSRARRAAR